jgi:hypothetical protein
VTGVWHHNDQENAGIATLTSTDCATIGGQLRYTAWAMYSRPPTDEESKLIQTADAKIQRSLGKKVVFNKPFSSQQNKIKEEDSDEGDSDEGDSDEDRDATDAGGDAMDLPEDTDFEDTDLPTAEDLCEDYDESDDHVDIFASSEVEDEDEDEVPLAQTTLPLPEDLFSSEDKDDMPLAQTISPDNVFSSNVAKKQAAIHHEHMMHEQEIGWLMERDALADKGVLFLSLVKNCSRFIIFSSFHFGSFEETWDHRREGGSINIIK